MYDYFTNFYQSHESIIHELYYHTDLIVSMIETDEVLVQAFRNGSDLGFVTLYNRYKQGVYAFCLKMLGNRDGAKDLVQAVFLKVYERCKQLEHTERFKAWLFTIARNDCLTYLRKSQSISELPDEMEDVNLVFTASNVERDEEIMLVNRAIERLKPDLREVILLREYENLSYREIAGIIGITEGVVKSRIFTARQRLYELLKPIYVERKSL